MGRQEHVNLTYSGLIFCLQVFSPAVIGQGKHSNQGVLQGNNMDYDTV